MQKQEFKSDFMVFGVHPPVGRTYAATTLQLCDTRSVCGEMICNLYLPSSYDMIE